MRQSFVHERVGFRRIPPAVGKPQRKDSNSISLDERASCRVLFRSKNSFGEPWLYRPGAVTLVNVELIAVSLGTTLHSLLPGTPQ